MEDPLLLPVLTAPRAEDACPEEMSPADFLMKSYKLCWCPVSQFHDWQMCGFAHNYQDVRRDPRLGYSPQLCPDWKAADKGLPYDRRCPRGFACPFAHGAKEQLYHPSFFRSVQCSDFAKGACPRGAVCAFYHSAAERRPAAEQPRQKLVSPEVLEAYLQPDFATPPFGPRPKWGWEAEVQAGSAARSAALLSDSLLLHYHSTQWASVFPDGYPSPFSVQVCDEGELLTQERAPPLSRKGKRKKGKQE